MIFGHTIAYETNFLDTVALPCKLCICIFVAVARPPEIQSLQQES